MKRFFKYTLITIVTLFAWTILIFIGTQKGWWHSAITGDNRLNDFVTAAKKEIKREFVGNFAMAILKKGQLEIEEFHSVGKAVDRNTVFQVASLSKWVSAVGIMKLVELGKLDLDKPVTNYLTRWKLPESAFDNKGVTVRRLLSHTAGLTDGLGYSGFESGDRIQSIESSLSKAADADAGISGKVLVGIEPGSQFKYSGGGYTLLQLIVEEVSGQSFTSFMKDSIFTPLQMMQSGYVWTDTVDSQLAEFYNSDGSNAPHFRYTSLAATSLYSSLADLQRFFQFFLAGPNKEAIGREVLQPETLKQMREVHATSFGMDLWGLGTILYTKADETDFIIGHDGKSTPPINTAIRLNPVTGDGIILLETGHPILATKLASEWVFWKTGQVDIVLFTLLKDQMVSTIGIGWIVIVLLPIGLAIIRNLRRRTKSTK